MCYSVQFEKKQVIPFFPKMSMDSTNTNVDWM